MDVVAWADSHAIRWAFTTSNAGSRYFEDYADLSRLDRIDWTAVHATQWQQCKEGKQAEFLLEKHFPWHLVERIGVCCAAIQDQVLKPLLQSPSKPPVEVLPEWYY